MPSEEQVLPMPRMAADISGIITFILLGGVLLFVGISVIRSDFPVAAICLLAGIVMIISSIKSII